MNDGPLAELVVEVAEDLAELLRSRRHVGSGRYDDARPDAVDVAPNVFEDPRGGCRARPVVDDDEKLARVREELLEGLGLATEDENALAAKRQTVVDQLLSKMKEIRDKFFEQTKEEIGGAEKLAEIFGPCILCHNCRTACPVSIDGRNLIRETRALLVEDGTNVPDQIARALDGGAPGIIVPDVEPGDQAVELARNVRFPPLGRRSISGLTTHTGYAPMPLADLVSAANSETC